VKPACGKQQSVSQSVNIPIQSYRALQESAISNAYDSDDLPDYFQHALSACL